MRSNYSQDNPGNRMSEDAMSGIDASDTQERDMYGNSRNDENGSGGRLTTGMQGQAAAGQNGGVAGQQGMSDPRNAGSGGPGGRVGSVTSGSSDGNAQSMQSIQQMGGMFSNPSFNMFTNISNNGMPSNNMMMPNGMTLSQQQANINLMTHMMNTNPVYAANMMSNAMAIANASSQMQQQSGNQMMGNGGSVMNPNNGAGNPQDNMMTGVMQNAMNPMAMMSGSQMMPNMMMNNNAMLPSLQNPVSNHGGHPNNKGTGRHASDAGIAAASGSGQAHSNSVDMNMASAMQNNNPYQAMSRQSSISQSRQASLSQPTRRGSMHASPTIQQSPTSMGFPSSMQSQANQVVPIVNSAFPEYGSSGSAFATGGVSMNTSQDSYRNAYSSTGFDMLTVLMRVATRKNAQISIGNVDLSCAFVVCDTMQHDIPIVYCSENFERLTGYSKHEILGRNCRFLQAPSGHVQAGVRRKYVDDDVVLHLKNAINSRSEAQVSVINYRKGGQPFMNLLTMIPIPYDTDEIKYYVGFQVDLVEQPHSVTKKNPNGTYTINYQRGLQMPRYVFTGQESKRHTAMDSGQTIPRDEVSTVLSTIGSGESDLSRRIWDKVLLENTDDVIFVLSLKGLFLYLSPSCHKILEYDANELMGAALSSVCHPSDIVPVTRELKDTTTGADVSVVFRIRRKESGYMWFEGHGSLYVEQGKGRKSIVLVGRERPVYTLKQTDILTNGGIGENEVWTKLSTSGMFLYVSSSIRSLIDKQPSELVGTSIQSLMRPDSRSEFGRILEIARSGKRAQTRHELVNRRGQVLQAFSTVHPGDATEGSKPTFFVAQTRLLKYSRPASVTNNPRPPNQQGSSNPSKGVTAQNRGSLSRSASSVGSFASPSQYMSTFEAAATYAGGDSLPLGHQDVALADELNLFDELKTTRSTSWQYELRQMEKRNRVLAEELQGLLQARKKRKRRKPGVMEKECANCHTKQTPEWRRGPSGNRDLCNSCGLRWAKQQGRISPRTTSQRSAPSATSDPHSDSPRTSVPNQSGAQPRRMSGSVAAAAGEKEQSASAGQSVGESRSIDETLAQSSQQHQGQSQPVVSAAASPPASKATKMEESSRSPPSANAFGTAVPTKIEEEED
ncbi:MAG: hypothetical protein Q9159_005037 [Coniocarpon cinnabarinum]